MSSSFTALATILGGFISGITGIAVFLFRDAVERRREKEEWYEDIIKYSYQIIRISERYEDEKCGRLVRDLCGRMHTQFQNHIESEPEVASDEVMEKIHTISDKCHDISNTRIHNYEGGEKDGESHLQNRHENLLTEVTELCEELNEECKREREQIGWL